MTLRHGIAPLAVLLALTASGGATASGPGASPAAAVEARARSLLEAGQVREALSVLKAGLEVDGEATALRWLLVRAYLADGNDFWAIRTLAALAERAPEDCEPHLWIAFVHLRQGGLDQAGESLALARCTPGPSSARRALLQAELARQAGRTDEALRHLRAVRLAETLYEEDRARAERLVRSLERGWLPPLAARLELQAGWAANALAGSPADVGTRETDVASPAGQLSLWARLAPPVRVWVRPVVEAEVRALGYATGPGRDLGYLMLGGRPGVRLGPSGPVLAYRYEGLLLGGGDRYASGPVWFYAAHRGELEADLSSQLTAFAGVGRRRFREVGRTRTEVDGGIGGGLAPHGRIRLLGAGSLRWHAATNPAYDQRGGSAIGSVELSLAPGWSLRALGLAGLNDHPRSAGYFDATHPRTHRRELLVKFAGGPSFAPHRGLRLGLTYEFAQRFSTADPYDYRDHRVLFRVALDGAADPWGPATLPPDGRVPLDHGDDGTGFGERIQDLLRQDEAAQRGSSCVE